MRKHSLPLVNVLRKATTLRYLNLKLGIRLLKESFLSKN